MWSSNNSYSYFRSLLMVKKNWKDRQYAAITRLTKKRGWDFSDNNPYFERACIFLPKVSIKTKQQLRKELKKHGYK